MFEKRSARTEYETGKNVQKAVEVVNMGQAGKVEMQGG